MSDGPLAVEAHDLSRRFGSRWALARVAIELPQGRSLLLAGPNGAGKTTLLRILATAIRPSSGSLKIYGIDADQDPVGVRRKVGLLSHRGYLYAELTAKENLISAADLLGASRERVMPLLERVGLAHRAKDPVRTFSAGMRKRLAFARLLLQDPQLILLDEPYGQLDPAGFDFVDRLLRELAAEGRTLIVSTHLVSRGSKRLQTGLVLADGRPCWAGPAIDLPEAMNEVIGRAA